MGFESEMWSLFLTVAAFVAYAHAHGRVFAPPSRASAWRFGFPTTPDYDDDGANCGGFSMQWSVNRGKCGICGDAYNIPPPRPHELGGMYGQGIIVEHYTPGATFTTTVDLTTSHRGFWEFKLCPDPENNEQECFDQHLLELENGDTKYYPNRGSAKYNVTYRLPQGLVCEHCVLQWRYTAGNNWGDCKNGTQGLGCGNQEQFGACSDISIGVMRDTDTNEVKSYDDLPYSLLYYLKHGYFDTQGILNLFHNGHVRPQQGSYSKPKGTKAEQSPRSPRTNALQPNSKAKTKKWRYKTKLEKKRRQKRKKSKYKNRKKKMRYWK